MAAFADNLLPPNEAKRRTARIETDYLRRRNPLEPWKIALAAIAGISAVVWVAYASITGRHETIASRGPVVFAHAMWENNCQTCHLDFIPIGGSAAGLALDRWAHATDENCQQCHAGPGHHPSTELLDESAGVHHANCAVCHVDHRGRDADLTRVADRHCTVCHADLRNHSTAGAAIDDSIAQVKRFEIDAHPAFRSLARDPGRLKFNHALHMTAGLSHDKAGRNPFKLSDLPEAFRKQYEANANKSGLIQLQCASCHELNYGGTSESNGVPAVLGVARAKGDYYRPVVYERHCQACHPLTYTPGSPEAFAGQIPHRLNGQQLENRVREVALADLVRKTPELTDWGSETIPGNKPPSVTETGRTWMESQVQQSARHLRSAVCAKCHDVAADGAKFPDVGPTHIPAVWLKRARFDHSAHRMVACSDCHPRAYSEHAQASRVASDVLVRDLESCAACHAAGSAEGGQMAARHDCVECHLYHGRAGDKGLLDGRGSRARAASNPRSTEELLNLR
jgi:hypothetical protein